MGCLFKLIFLPLWWTVRIAWIALRTVLARTTPLVSEILEGVRAGRQGVFVSEPEHLRTAIFVRGLSLGEFARRAGIAPSTLSRALAGQPISPASWRLLITTLGGL